MAHFKLFPLLEKNASDRAGRSMSCRECNNAIKNAIK